MIGLSLNDPIQLSPGGQGQYSIEIPAGETRYFAISFVETVEACMFNIYGDWVSYGGGATYTLYQNGDVVRQQSAYLVLDAQAGDYVIKIDVPANESAATTIYVLTLS